MVLSIAILVLAQCHQGEAHEEMLAARDTVLRCMAGRALYCTRTYIPQPLSPSAAHCAATHPPYSSCFP